MFTAYESLPNSRLEFARSSRLTRKGEARLLALFQ
jgi:hypothetical protein